jgi:competence protein ComEC
LFSLNQNIGTDNLIKTDNLILFQNKKILIFNKDLQNRQLPYKLKVDYLYITGNPHTDINMINKNFDYATLVIDASNADRLINDLAKQAQCRHINYQIIKRNNSVIAASD